MSVEVESRGRTRLFRGSIRSLLGHGSVLRRGGSNLPDAQALAASQTPAHTMFQDARNTSIQNATFNIYSSGSTIASGHHSLESGTSPQTYSGSSSSSLESRPPSESPLNDINHLSWVNEPFPVPQTGPEIYAYHLMRQNRGYPLWIPSPNMTLPAPYRSSGVRVGDVGIITPEGGFSFFFNVFHDATHPINAEMLLPDDFIPFVPRGASDMITLKESSAMNYLSDESVTRIDCGEDSLKTVLKTSAKQSAILMMPEPVFYTGLQGVNRLRQYVKHYLQGWYRFVRNELGRDVENGDLRVVYGCRKSSGFGIATVANGSPDSMTELTFSIDDSWMDVTGCKYRWHHRGSAEIKAGPSLDETADLRELEPNHGAPANQCLFLSTLDFSLSDDEWARVDSDESLALPARTSTAQITSTGTLMSHALPHTRSLASSSAPAPQGRGFTTSPSNTGWNQRVSSRNLFHPANVLGRFLLNIVPGATFVAIASEDWGPFMTENINDTSSFICNVLSANHVCVTDGMVYLCPMGSITMPLSGFFPGQYVNFMDLFEDGLSVMQRRSTLYHETHRAMWDPKANAMNDDILEPLMHLLGPQQPSVKSCAPFNDVPTLRIGVYDPYHQINNQVTVLITITDDTTIQTEIKDAIDCPPGYTLIVDRAEGRCVDLDLDWFNPRPLENAFDPLLAFYMSLYRLIRKSCLFETEPTVSAKGTSAYPVALPEWVLLERLVSLARKLCQLSLFSVGLGPLVSIVSQRIPRSVVFRHFEIEDRASGQNQSALMSSRRSIANSEDGKTTMLTSTFSLFTCNEPSEQTLADQSPKSSSVLGSGLQPTLHSQLSHSYIEGRPSTGAQGPMDPLFRHLMETEKWYIDILGEFLQVIENFSCFGDRPPHQLQPILRNLEGIHTVHESFFERLRCISVTKLKSRTEELRALFGWWINTLGDPYGAYSSCYFSCFDNWEPVRSSLQLANQLRKLPSKVPSSDLAVTWTLDTIFDLPRVRLDYYLRLYQLLRTKSDDLAIPDEAGRLHDILMNIRKRSMLPIDHPDTQPSYSEPISSPFLPSRDPVWDKQASHRKRVVAVTEKSTNSGGKHPDRPGRAIIIACNPCAERKIRCDTGRPACSNCVRRSSACYYPLLQSGSSETRTKHRPTPSKISVGEWPQFSCTPE